MYKSAAYGKAKSCTLLSRICRVVSLLKPLEYKLLLALWDSDAIILYRKVYI